MENAGVATGLVLKNADDVQGLGNWGHPEINDFEHMITVLTLIKDRGTFAYDALIIRMDKHTQLYQKYCRVAEKLHDFATADVAWGREVLLTLPDLSEAGDPDPGDTVVPMSVMRRRAKLRSVEMIAGWIQPEAMLRHYFLSPPENLEDCDVCLRALKTAREAMLSKIERGVVEIDEMLDQPARLSIVEATREFMIGRSGSLLDVLQNEASPSSSETEAEVKAFPRYAIARLLNSDLATRFAKDLLKALDWYGADQDQTTSPLIMAKLVWKAIAVDLDPESDIKGYEIDSFSNWGNSYAQVYQAIESHLRNALPSLSSKNALLAVLLLKANMPAELIVAGVSPHLTYRRSATWVHLQHGINLAHTLMPGSERTLTFEELMSYPTRLLKDATEERNLLVASTLTPAILQWAEANQIIARMPATGYSAEQTELACTAFTEREQKVEQAVAQIRTPMPDRLQMARAELEKRGIDPALQFVDRRELYTRPSVYKVTAATRYPALDLVAEGKLQRDDHSYYPSIYGPEGSHDATAQIGPVLANIGDILDTSSGTDAAVAQYRGLPDISAQFDADFEQWWTSSTVAFETLFKALLDDLPNDEREAIEHGTVTLYTLRKPGEITAALHPDPSIDASLKVPANADASVARYGFILVSGSRSKRFFHELFPYAGFIRRRDDFEAIELQLDGLPTAALPVDWSAYSAGSTPDLNSRSIAVIHHLQTFLKDDPAQQPPIADRATGIASAIAKQLSLRDKPLAYKTARGTTVFDDPGPLIKVLKFIVPLWGPVEDLIELWNTPRRERSILKTLLAVVGLIGDVLSLVFPIAKIVGLTARFAKHAVTLGLRSALPQLTHISKTTAIGAYQIFNPLAGSYDLLKLTGNKLIRLTQPVMSKISIGVKQSIELLRLRIGQHAGRNFLSLTQEQAVLWKADVIDHKLLTVDDFPNTLVFEQATSSLGHPQRYLIDPVSHRPFGTALMQTSDAGDLTRHVPRQMNVELLDAHWVLLNETPALTKQWTRWGDDLFLESGGITYKLTPHNNGNILKRIGSSEPYLKKDPLTLGPCRIQRSPLDLNPCKNAFININHSGLTARMNQGRNAQPWFTDLKITPATGAEQLIHNGHVYSTAGSTLKKGAKLKPSDYKPMVSIEITGGNEIFKRIKIEGGIVNNVSDTRELSAVVAIRKTDKAQIIVTRADAVTYYSGPYSAGAKLNLTRMDDLDLLADPVTDNDFLVHIFNGSHDANLYIKKLGAHTIAEDLKKIRLELDAGRTPYVNKTLSNGPFEMGTTPEEAALFCKYTRSKLTIQPSEMRASWTSIDKNMPAHTRQAISDELNRLHIFANKNDVFTLNNIVNKGATSFGLADRKKTIAYMKIRYKDPVANPDTVYYAVSGLKKPATDLSISRFAQGDKSVTPGAGWRIDNGVVVSPEKVRYIDAQPMRTAAQGDPREVIYLPDLKSHSKLENPGNHRMLDSEHSIMNRLKTDNIDFNKIDSVQVFSSNPTCPSCTMGLYGLTTKLPPGKFQIFQGA